MDIQLFQKLHKFPDWGFPKILHFAKKFLFSVDIPEERQQTALSVCE